MDLNNFTEVKIIKRGSYYLTPLKSFHIDELERVLSKENRREIKLLGYCDVRTALEVMSKTSEAYVCRKRIKIGLKCLQCFPVK